MLEKIILPHSFDIPGVNVVRPSDVFGVKCASASGVSVCGRTPSGCGVTCATKQANEDLKGFVRALKPDPKYLYLHIIALGAGEYFGPNSNGDHFPESYLTNRHGTFCTHAKLYKHHINKDPKQSYGHPVFSTYNGNMHRVELITAVDREKAPDIVHKAESGEPLGFSMSCRIPFDICSICGNKARTRAQYCTHIRNELLSIRPDGRQVCMINIDPTFFDISYVLRPADKTAMGLSKVASRKPDGLRIADCGLRKSPARNAPGQAEIQNPKSKIDKAGVIKKEIEVLLTPLKKKDIERFLKYAMPLLEEMEPELPVDGLGRYSLRDVLSTLAVCGVVCRPKELGALLAIRKVPNPRFEISGNCFNDDVYEIIRGIVPGRSFFTPHIMLRLEKAVVKTGFVKTGSKPVSTQYAIRQAPVRKETANGNKALIAAGLGGGAAYAAYRTETGKKMLESIIDMLGKTPGKFLLLAGLGALAFETAPLFLPRRLSDSMLVHHGNIPDDTEGIIVKPAEGKPEIIKQAIGPFGLLFMDNYYKGPEN